MVKTKKEKIAEFEQKGAEWCAKKLYEMREKYKECAETRQAYKRTNKILKIKDAIEEKIVKENEILKEILEENGIRPHRLLVTYIDVNCEHCENNGFYDGEWNCEGCGHLEWHGNFERYIETFSFYSYRIDEERLRGITSGFDEADFEVLRVEDANTGKVLYENEQVDEED